MMVNCCDCCAEVLVKGTKGFKYNVLSKGTYTVWELCQSCTEQVNDFILGIEDLPATKEIPVKVVEEVTEDKEEE